MPACFFIGPNMIVEERASRARRFIGSIRLKNYSSQSRKIRII